MLTNFSTFLPKKDGPNEKDRILLVEYQCVIDEFLNLKPSFQSIIADITRKMGDGMADYASGEHRINTAIEKVADFDLYCYYVAGLVGHGLSDLFAASGFEDETISEKKELSNAMGKFLQKTNIIRDYLEDLVDGRQFWPKEIWGQYVENFADLAKPGFEDKVNRVFSFPWLRDSRLEPGVKSDDSLLLLLLPTFSRLEPASAPWFSTCSRMCPTVSSTSRNCTTSPSSTSAQSRRSWPSRLWH